MFISISTFSDRDGSLISRSNYRRNIKIVRVLNNDHSSLFEEKRNSFFLKCYRCSIISSLISSFLRFCTQSNEYSYTTYNFPTEICTDISSLFKSCYFLLNFLCVRSRIISSYTYLVHCCLKNNDLIIRMQTTDFSSHFPSKLISHDATDFYNPHLLAINTQWKTL